MNNILLIISFLLLIVAIYFYFKTKNIKVEKDKQQQEYYYNLLQNIGYNNTVILEQKNNIENLERQALQKKVALNKQYQELQNKKIEEMNTNLRREEENIKLKIDKTNQQVDQQIISIYSDLDSIRKSADKQKKQITSDLQKLKSTLAAGVQIKLRQQQKIEKINFYKLSVSPSDLSDIKILEDLKPSLHKPVVLSKLIWSQYFQKQMTELCDRVLNKKTVCGIYKITNLLTQQCYIGQSINVADRWKQHCKCGLGIEASSSNALYNAMQKDGVWNFSFELLEQCPKNLLNEKEVFWIELYQSNKFGYNGNSGIKK